MRRTTVLVLDVNETLSDLAGLDPVLAELGADPGTGPRWFAGVLRDGFARCLSGEPAPFAAVASAGLRGVLGGVVPAADLDGAVQRVMSAFSALDLHPDVAPGLATLAATDLRLVALTNGGAAVPEALLRRAGVLDVFERVLSVEGAPAWKPDPRSYRWALSEVGAEPAEAMMVACHPWDLDGAARAGLGTAYVDRTGAPYPDVFVTPDVTVATLGDLAAALRA